MVPLCHREPRVLGIADRAERREPRLVGTGLREAKHPRGARHVAERQRGAREVPRHDGAKEEIRAPSQRGEGDVAELERLERLSATHEERDLQHRADRTAARFSVDHLLRALDEPEPEQCVDIENRDHRLERNAGGALRRACVRNPLVRALVALLVEPARRDLDGAPRLERRRARRHRGEALCQRAGLRELAAQDRELRLRQRERGPWRSAVLAREQLVDRPLRGLRLAGSHVTLRAKKRRALGVLACSRARQIVERTARRLVVCSAELLAREETERIEPMIRAPSSDVAQDPLEPRRSRGRPRERMLFQDEERPLRVIELDPRARSDQHRRVVVGRRREDTIAETGERLPRHRLGLPEHVAHERRCRCRDRDALAFAHDDQVLAELVDRRFRPLPRRAYDFCFVECRVGSREERKDASLGAAPTRLDRMAKRLGRILRDTRAEHITREREVDQHRVATGRLGDVSGERTTARLLDRANELDRRLLAERLHLEHGRPKRDLLRAHEAARHEHETRERPLRREARDERRELARRLELEVVPDQGRGRADEEPRELIVIGGAALGPRDAHGASGPIDRLARSTHAFERHDERRRNLAHLGCRAERSAEERGLADPGSTVDEDDGALRHEGAHRRSVFVTADERQLHGLEPIIDGQAPTFVRFVGPSGVSSSACARHGPRGAERVFPLRGLRSVRTLRIDLGQCRYRADAVSPQLRSNAIAARSRPRPFAPPPCTLVRLHGSGGRRGVSWAGTGARQKRENAQIVDALRRNEPALNAAGPCPTHVHSHQWERPARLRRTRSSRRAAPRQTSSGLVERTRSPTTSYREQAARPSTSRISASARRARAATTASTPKTP